MNCNGSKTCSSCGACKPLTEFAQARYYRGGYRGQCKACVRAGEMRLKLERRQQGLCRCGKRPVRIGRTSCEVCAGRVDDEATHLFYERKVAGACVECGEPAMLDTLRCAACEDKHKHPKRTVYQQRKAAGICTGCGGPRDCEKLMCGACREVAHRASASNYRKKKLRVLERYGGAFCACCGESELKFLTLDHIANDGKEHRLQLASDQGGYPDLYKWAMRNDFPPGLRVLCYNCNIGRARNKGICPHAQATS